MSLLDASTWLTLPGLYRNTSCREREWTVDHIHTSFTTQGHGGPPRLRDQLNAGATSETTQTWKTIHTIHAPIHSNKANMKAWLWRPNDIRGPCGLKASWHLSYRWVKTPKKPHAGNVSRPGNEPGPAAWQARMLPPAPQRWTSTVINLKNLNLYFLLPIEKEIFSLKIFLMSAYCNSLW